MEAKDLREIIKSENFSDYGAEIKKAYFEQFGKRVKTKCPDCLKDAAFELYSSLTANNDTRAYQMLHYTVVTDEETGKAYTHNTITDEVAEKILKKHPELSERFKLLPL